MPGKALIATALFAVSSSLTACATLEVQLDILNPVEADRVRQNAVLDRLAMDVIESNGGATEMFLEREGARRQALVDAYAREMSELVQQTDNALKQDLILSAVADFQEDYEEEVWNPALEAYRPLLQANEDAMLARATSLTIGATSAGRSEIRQLANIRQGLIRQMSDSALGQLDPALNTFKMGLATVAEPAPQSPAPATKTAAPAPQLAGAADDAKEKPESPETEAKIVTPAAASIAAASVSETAALKRNLKSVVPGSALSQSDYAYAVLSAEDWHWRENFNRAEGKGRFGNSDIAIKLDPSGNFTVKGMKFDPSTVASVASKVSTQALLLAAQISGVPTAYSGSPSTGLQATSTGAAIYQQTSARREAELAAYRDALRYLARTILSEETAIKTDAASLARANTVINGQFEAYSAILTPAPATTANTDQPASTNTSEGGAP